MNGSTTLEGAKVKMASIHFDGNALNWYQTFLKTRENCRMLSWSEFVDALTVRFGKQMFVDLVVEIKKLEQIGTLQHYLDEFDIRLSNTNLNEAQATSHYLGELKEEIEISIRLFNPTILQSAYAFDMGVNASVLVVQVVESAIRAGSPIL